MSDTSSTPQASGEAKVSELCPFGAFESEHNVGACPCFPGVVLGPGEAYTPRTPQGGNNG